MKGVDAALDILSSGHGFEWTESIERIAPLGKPLERGFIDLATKTYEIIQLTEMMCPAIPDEIAQAKNKVVTLLQKATEANPSVLKD